MRRFVAVALAAGMALQASPGFAGTRAGQLAAACASCHRSDGLNTGIPAVIGSDGAQLEQSMLAYRSGTGSQIMQVVAAALTPEQIAEVVHFLADQPAKSAK